MKFQNEEELYDAYEIIKGLWEQSWNDNLRIGMNQDNLTINLELDSESDPFLVLSYLKKRKIIDAEFQYSDISIVGCDIEILKELYKINPVPDHDNIERAINRILNSDTTTPIILARRDKYLQYLVRSHVCTCTSIFCLCAHEAYDIINDELVDFHGAFYHGEPFNWSDAPPTYESGYHPKNDIMRKIYDPHIVDNLDTASTKYIEWDLKKEAIEKNLI